MKYLNIPTTLLFYFIFGYYSFYLVTASYIFIFNQNFFFFIFFYLFAISLTHFLSVSIPSIAKIIIVSIYKDNFLVKFIHGFVGLFGSVCCIIFLFNYPPQYIVDGKSAFFLRGMLVDAPMKFLYFLQQYFLSFHSKMRKQRKQIF